MPKLNIPERYRAGVAAIRELDERSIQEIKTALDGAGDRTSDETGAVSNAPREVAITALKTVSTEKAVDLRRIAETVAALYGVKSTRDQSVEDFVEDVCDAMESLQNEELRLPHSERPQFRAKLVTLLNAEVFGLVAKVHDSATEDERVFCHARILSDLRPVFGPKVEDGPRAMLIVHLLKLVYHEGTEKHKAFYVALDSDDLSALKQIIERAEVKAKTLRSATKATRLFGVSKE